MRREAEPSLGQPVEVTPAELRRHQAADGVILGSKNGSFVGERRISSAVRLADGAEFRLGAVRRRLRILKRLGSTETAGPDKPR